MELIDKLILDLYDDAMHARMDEFMFAAMDNLTRALHFDSGCSISFDPMKPGETGVKTLHLHNQPIEKFRDRTVFKQNEKPEGADSAFAKALRTPGRSITETLTDIPLDQKELRAYCNRYDVRNTLVISLRAQNNDGSVVALWRSNIRQQFTQEELMTANRLLPHMIKSRGVNIALHGTKNGFSEAPFLVTNQQGLIYFFNESAQRVLRSRWSQWEPPLLPPELLEGITIAGRKQLCIGNLIASTIEEGKLLYIRLSSARHADALTGAEQAVARLASEGLPTKEIARRLGISPSTARNQLHSCYVKLNVSNRTALARFFSAMPLIAG